MTLNFETDNIFYVPRGETLHIYDLYHWRMLSLDVHNFRIYLNTTYLRDIKKKVSEAYRRAAARQSFASRKEQVESKLKAFFESVEKTTPPPEQNTLLQRTFAPQQVTLWAYLSDAPLESFFPEDYEQPKSAPRTHNFSPLYGALFFSTLGGYELMLPQEDYDQAFLLDIPSAAGITVSQILPDQLLPVESEFCGSFGYSNKGNLVTYTQSSQISPENLCCIPLYHFNNSLYATLYLHLKTPVEYDIMVRPPERVVPTLRNLFAEHGFQCILEQKGNAIYRRHDDVLHFYENVAGKESLGSRFLAPFIVLVHKNGTYDPGERSKLIDELGLNFR
jgi:hypothetical protein